MVNKLRVVSMSRDAVLLDASVVRNHDLVRSTFGAFDVRPVMCPHDITDRYMVKVSNDQWKFVASKVIKNMLQGLEHPPKKSKHEQDS